jgi:hypothetical protein
VVWDDLYLLEPGASGLQGTRLAVHLVSTAHLDEQLECREPLATVFEGGYQAAAGHHIWMNAILLHLLKHLHHRTGICSSIPLLPIEFQVCLAFHQHFGLLAAAR